MQHGVGIAEALEQAQPLAQQWVVDAEDLHHAARPADALVDVRAKAVGGQPGRLRDAQPPIASIASRRSTAQEPQKNAAFHRSLPSCTSP
ncbi:hypothetical protein G6F63_016595 [Rhizopus arrhizus]|nr:hypothetical protein G6F63_016595 [Rhizopus arrhizus]